MTNVFEREYSEIERRKEAIDSVATELKKEFKGMDLLNAFIDYLANFEKMIAGFSGNKKEFEEEYIEIEMSSLSAQLHIPTHILSLLYKRFEEELNLENIEQVKEEILRKYSSHEDYQKLIEYLEKVFGRIDLMLKEENKKEGEDFNSERFKEELIEKKIQELSADGDPKEEELREIVKAFKNKLIEEIR